jgi:hypothetical protein
MRPSCSHWFSCLVLVITISAPAHAVDSREIDVAIDKGKKFLWSQQKDGRWEAEFEKRGDQSTGQTAMVVLAMLATGESYQDERLAAAIDYVKKTPTTGVYALGVRCQLWLSLPPTPETRKLMAQDSKALINAIQREGTVKGFYGYNPDARAYSLSRAHYAVLGVWAAAQHGIEVPNAYWQFVEKSWIEQQDPSGGWSYKGASAKGEDRERYPVTPGITADGIATLFITQDYLHADEAVVPRGNVKNPHLDKAMSWLSSNFKLVADDTKFARAYPYATLYAIERVGAASGLKYFGDIDWYELGAERLLRNQRSDGSWPGDAPGFKISGTSFALLFLSKGRAPVVMNKLAYDVAGKEAHWNQRPRDAANVTRWIAKQIERDLKWQIVNLDAPIAELHDAPILYLCGNQDLKLDKKHIDKLRQYVEGGGILLGNADANTLAFVSSFKKLGKELFPSYEFRQLPMTHVIFRQLFPPEKWKRKPNVLGMSNGARELVLLVPDTDLARAWQMQEVKSREELFQLMANLYLYSVDKTGTLTKGQTYQVTLDPQIKPTETLTVARLKYAGSWDPEPGGWRRMTALLNNRDRIGLKVVPTDPSVPDSLKSAKIAHLTGVGRFKLADEARAAVKQFVEAGGLLVVDAAAGNSEFAKSAEAELAAMFGEPAAAQLKQPVAADHPLYNVGGRPLGDVGYRTFAKGTLTGELKLPRLRGIELGGRLAIVYSPEDLSVGLVGHAVDGIVGYDPRTATAIMRNLLLLGAGKSKPSTAPTPAATTKAAGAGSRGAGFAGK